MTTASAEPTWRQSRGKVAYDAVSGSFLPGAGLSRKRTQDDPELLAARRDLKEARLADYIRRTVDAAPPLTPEQRDKLALLLTGGAPGAA